MELKARLECPILSYELIWLLANFLPSFPNVVIVYIQEINKEVKIFAKKNLEQKKTLDTLIKEYDLDENDVEKLAAKCSFTEEEKGVVDAMVKIAKIFAMPAEENVEITDANFLRTKKEEIEKILSEFPKEMENASEELIKTFVRHNEAQIKQQVMGIFREKYNFSPKDIQLGLRLIQKKTASEENMKAAKERILEEEMNNINETSRSECKENVRRVFKILLRNHEIEIEERNVFAVKYVQKGIESKLRQAELDQKEKGEYVEKDPVDKQKELDEMIEKEMKQIEERMKDVNLEGVSSVIVAIMSHGDRGIVKGLLYFVSDKL